MKIAAVLASYTMADADGLRKAMGKKIAEKMAEHRETFMEGARKNSHPEDKAKAIFDLMEKFGGYGFNKSHSAAYALIAYQTAYLKAHYPVEFLAALLTSEITSIDGVVKFIAECKSHDIEVLPPDINTSSKVFSVDEGRIRFGLVAVKNVGGGAIDAIIQERENAPLTSIFNFCERVDLRKVNRRVIEALIKCGAFDTTGASRAQMLAALDEAMDYGQKVQRERCDPQMGLFGGDSCPEPMNAPELPPVEEWDPRQLLAFEKEALGFYFSGHPLNRFRDIIDKFANANAVTIKEAEDGAPVRIGGLISTFRNLRTKKGDPMAFATVEDPQGTVEVVVFPETYAASLHLLEEDRPVLVQGQIQKEENGVKIIAEQLVPMEKAEEVWTASVRLTLDMSRIDVDRLKALRDLLRRHPGGARHICTSSIRARRKRWWPREPAFTSRPA